MKDMQKLVRRTRDEGEEAPLDCSVETKDEGSESGVDGGDICTVLQCLWRGFSVGKDLPTGLVSAGGRGRPLTTLSSVKGTRKE